jgi:hypothetical protein
MAKKEPLVSYEMSDIKKLPRSEQRRLLDLGMVKGETPPTTEVEAPKAPSAKK